MTKTEQTGEVKSIFKEVLWPFTLVTGVILGLTYGVGHVPFLAPHIQWLVAATFIGIPAFILRKRGATWESIGAIRESWWNYLKPAFVIAAVVFPLYVAGYHWVQTTLLEKEFVSADLHLWVEDTGPLSLVLEGPRPIEKRPEQLGKKTLEVWEERGSLYILWSLQKDQKLDLTFETNGNWGTPSHLQLKDGLLYHRKTPGSEITLPAPETMEIQANKTGGVILTPEHADTFQMAALINQQPLSGRDIRLGEFGLSSGSSGSWQFTQSLLWLISLLLMHIIMVGVPEEIFYRGLIQTKLQAVFPDRWTFLGTQWGPSVIVTSALFALGHFLIELDPGRLIVFFPSLLFGWMKNRQGTIGSVAVFHGLCNVLLNILQRFYVV